MPDLSAIGAAIIGTGFISAVHLGALRRLGVSVTGVLGSSPVRGALQAQALGVPRSYGSLEELLADPAVHVVHVTSPNLAHYAQVRQILAAGRHVICEKPLAMTSVQSAEMVVMAQASGKVAAVCYNTRFYPLNQHAHGMMAAGELGELRLITGQFHQDWLAKDTDWNWRLEAEKGGPLRSVSDIGTHWVDLTSFITGQRPVAVMADLATFIAERQKPLGPVETFAATRGATETRRIFCRRRGDHPAALSERRARGSDHKPDKPWPQRAADLGHFGRSRLGGVERRKPRNPMDRPPRCGKPVPVARPVADERIWCSGGCAAGWPSRGLY